ncbi:MAG: hypothetical protein HY211_02295 [Candidatus Omnitrophica bacterium]|nr:hypothetical protein [Candidatus Omnitrophota bacterium]
MKLRPMTWGRWAELIFGALFPTVVLGPTAALGMFFLVSALYTVVMSILLGHQALQALTWAQNVFGLVWLSVPGMGGIISLWLVVLFGPEQIHRHPILRRFVISTIVLAEIAALLFLFGIGTFFNSPLANLKTTWIAVFILISSMAVGFRYLPSLLRETSK